MVAGINLDSYTTASIAGIISTPIISFFNGLSVAGQAFVVFMAVDVVLGSWNAHLKGEFKRQALATKFLTKLMVYLGILSVAYYVALMSGAEMINTLAMGVMLSKEGLSILTHGVEMEVFKKAELGWLQTALEKVGGKKED